MRNTKDVDVLLEHRDLPSAMVSMEQAGFTPQEVHGVSMFIEMGDPMPSRAVHWIFANEPVRPNELASAPPVKTGMCGPEGVRILDLPELGNREAHIIPEDRSGASHRPVPRWAYRLGVVGSSAEPTATKTGRGSGQSRRLNWFVLMEERRGEEKSY